MYTYAMSISDQGRHHLVSSPQVRHVREYSRRASTRPPGYVGDCYCADASNINTQLMLGMSALSCQITSGARLIPTR